MEFTKIENFNPENIKFSTTKNQRGKRFINVFYDKKPLALKFPSLRIPFNTAMNQYGQLEVNMSLDKNDVLTDKIKLLDEKMEEFCKNLEWFTPKDFENAVYTPMLKTSLRGDYPPTIKLKIPIKEDREIKTLFYDFNKKKLSIKNPEDVSEVLKQGTKVQSAAECVGVWFMNNRYGLSWKAEQIRITESSNKISSPVDEDYAFCSDSEDEGKSDTDLLISDDE